jgi:predicted N-acyltransferase
MQFHWRNQNKDNNNEKYSTFDDYLAAFRSKRRQKIKKERKSIYENAQMTLHVYRGKEIPEEYFSKVWVCVCVYVCV